MNFTDQVKLKNTNKGICHEQLHKPNLGDLKIIISH